MAFIRASQGGGGSMSETVLWTNSSPTSNFDRQNVTLSQGMSGFKYLKLIFRVSTLNADTHSVMVDCTDFVNMQLVANGCVIAMAFVGSSVTYARRIGYVDDTNILIDKGIQVGGSTNTTNYNIPTQIIGLK